MSGDGLVRPLNAPAAAPLSPGVQPGVSFGIILAQFVIIFGASGGWFIYTGTPGLGNVPIAWGASGTKDPYGNTLPYASTLGIASTATFSAGNTLITPAGQFAYSAAPAAGKLIASVTPAAGTDPFSDVTEAGVSAYVTDVNSLRMAVNLNASSVGGNAGLSVQDTAHAPFAPPGAYGQGSGAGGLSRAVALLDSGLVANTDVDAVVSAQSQTHSGVTNGLVQALAGQVTLGNGPSLTVNDNTGAVTATGGSAAHPTLVTTDTWHSLSIGGSWTASGSGVNGFFYRLLSTGDVLLAWDVNNNSATPGTLGTLPAGYRPATTVRLHSGWTGTGPTTYNDQFGPALSISTGGAVAGFGLFVGTLTMFGTAVLPIGSL